MAKRPLVFGAGWLGTLIAQTLPGDLADVDICDGDSVRSALDSFRPTIIINAAGKTGRPNVDWCAAHPRETFHVNVFGAYNLTRICAERGLHIVHLGSGCCYRYKDQMADPFTEDSPPNFVGSTYSAAVAARQATLAPFANATLLRLRMPIDIKDHPRNLVTKVVGYARKGNPIVDARNSCTFVPDLVPALSVIIAAPVAGVFNMVSPGWFSPFDIARMFVKDAKPSTRAELDRICLEPRSHCLLTTTKIQAIGVKLTPASSVLDQIASMGVA